MLMISIPGILPRRRLALLAGLAGLLAPTVPPIFRPPLVHPLKYNSSTGHLMYNASGHLVDSCVAPCGSCASTPSTWTVSITQPSICACYASGGSSYQAVGSTNGTFTLTQDPVDPCTWAYTYDLSAISIVAYTGNLCTGTGVQDAVPFQLAISGTTFLGVTTWEIGVNWGSHGQFNAVMGSVDCTSPVSGTLVGVGCNSTISFFSGTGSFTATPNP